MSNFKPGEMPLGGLRSSCASVRLTENSGNKRQLFLVVDTSDGDSTVATFRNRVLADRQAALSPTYQVRDYNITMRD